MYSLKRGVSVREVVADRLEKLEALAAAAVKLIEKSEPLTIQTQYDEWQALAAAMRAAGYTWEP